MTVTHPRSGPGRIALEDPGNFLRKLTDLGVAYAVIGRWADPFSRGDVTGNGDGSRTEHYEILVDPAALDDLDAAAREQGLWTSGSDARARAVYRPDRGQVGPGWAVHARSELRYGQRVAWLGTGADEIRILRRAVEVDGIRLIAPSDQIVHLVLQAILDRRAFSIESRRTISELMSRLRGDPPAAGRAAERVQQELAPALSWSDLLADVVEGRWNRLLARRRGLRRLLWRRAPVSSTLGYLRSWTGGAKPPRESSRQPGPATAQPMDGGPADAPSPGQAARQSGPPLGRKQIRGSGLLLGGRGISTGLKFLAELLIVRYLTTTDYGTWTYALAAVVFLKAFATLGLNRAVVRFLPIHLERGERERFLGVTLFVLGGLLVSSAAVITLFYAFPGFVAGLAGAQPDQPIDLLFIVIFLLPIDAVDGLLTGLCAAFTASRTLFVRRYLLSPGLRIGVALTLVLLEADVRVLAYGYLLSGLAGVGYYAVSVYREIRKRGLLDDPISLDLALPVRQVLSYTIPVMAADSCAVLMTTGGPLLLAYFSDMSAVALFQVVIPLVTLTKVVRESFVVLFEPEASRLHSREDPRELDRFYWTAAAWVAILTFPGFAVAFTAAEPLTLLLYGERYVAAAPILSILAMGMFVDSVLGLNDATLRVVGKVRWLVGVNVAGAVINVGLNALLIPRMGALGAGVATGLAWVVYGILKQGALHAATGVRAFGLEYVGPYLAIGLSSVGLVTVRLWWPHALHVILPAVALAIVLVWLTARSHLSVSSTFPELARVPGLRAVLG